jgi:hypothetical protein
MDLGLPILKLLKAFLQGLKEKISRQDKRAGEGRRHKETHLKTKGLANTFHVLFHSDVRSFLDRSRKKGGKLYAQKPFASRREQTFGG